MLHFSVFRSYLLECNLYGYNKQNVTVNEKRYIHAGNLLENKIIISGAFEIPQVSLIGNLINSRSDKYIVTVNSDYYARMH